MAEGTTPEVGIIASDEDDAPEAMVLSKERWEQVRRLQREGGVNVSQIARRPDVDRKTVKKALLFGWKPYERPSRLIRTNDSGRSPLYGQCDCNHARPTLNRHKGPRDQSAVAAI